MNKCSKNRSRHSHKILHSTNILNSKSRKVAVKIRPKQSIYIHSAKNNRKTNHSLLSKQISFKTNSVINSTKSNLKNNAKHNSRSTLHIL